MGWWEGGRGWVAGGGGRGVAVLDKIEALLVIFCPRTGDYSVG